MLKMCIFDFLQRFVMHFGSVSEVPRSVCAREINTFTDAKCITNTNSII